MAVEIVDAAGGVLISAVLKRGEVEHGADSLEVLLGKNQQTLLRTSREMHADIPERLLLEGRGDKVVLVLQREWRERCQSANIARNRFKEAGGALIDRGALRLEGPHVFLIDRAPSEASEPL